MQCLTHFAPHQWKEVPLSLIERRNQRVYLLSGQCCQSPLQTLRDACHCGTSVRWSIRLFRKSTVGSVVESETATSAGQHCLKFKAQRIASEPVEVFSDRIERIAHNLQTISQPPDTFGQVLKLAEALRRLSRHRSVRLP